MKPQNEEAKRLAEIKADKRRLRNFYIALVGVSLAVGGGLAALVISQLDRFGLDETPNSRPERSLDR